MTHDVIIDGVNIRQQFRAYLQDGAYGPVLQWPSTKQVKQNEWQEEDGTESDLSDIKLDTRSLVIPFILKGYADEITAFYKFFGEKPSREFQFSALGQTLTLRLESMASLDYAMTFHILPIQFAADIPLEGYTYADPVSSLADSRDFILDGWLFSDYGMTILEGSIETVVKGEPVRPLLVRRPSVIDGATYDQNPVVNDPNDELPDDEYESVGSSYDGVAGTWKRSISVGEVTYKGKEITLNCLLRDTTAAAALRNYYALLYNLVRKDNTVDDALDACKRTLYCAANSTYYEGYYKSQRVKDAYFRDGLAWIEFSMTLAITKEFTLHRVLQDESGHVVLTENGYAILV